MTKLEKIITSLAYYVFIISISTLPTLLFTRFLRKYKYLFTLENKSNITYFENWLLLCSVALLFVILPIILIKVTEYKNNGIYGLFGVLLVLTLITISLLSQNKGEINNYIAICIYLFFCIIVWILTKSIMVIYAWLWTEKEENGEIKKDIDIKKVALLWTISATIIGILFGVKK